MSKVYLLKTKDRSPEALKQAGEKIAKVFSGFFGLDDRREIKGRYSW